MFFLLTNKHNLGGHQALVASPNFSAALFDLWDSPTKTSAVHTLGPAKGISTAPTTPASRDREPPRRVSGVVFWCFLQQKSEGWHCGCGSQKTWHFRTVLDGFDPPFGIIEATKRKDIACHCIQTILIKHGNWHKHLGLNWLNQPTKIWGQSQQPMSSQQPFQALRSGAIGLTSPSFASQLPTESSTSDNPSKWEISQHLICTTMSDPPIYVCWVTKSPWL